MKLPGSSTRNRDTVLSEAVMQAAQFHMSGQWDQAEKIYKSVLKTKSDHFDAKQLLGDLRFRQKRFDEAQKLLRQAIAINGSVAEVHLTLGKTLSALNKHEDALRSFDRAVALKPDLVDAHYERGHAARLTGNFAKSIEGFDAVIALKPLSYQAHNSKGVVLKETGNLAKALESYKTAISIKGDFVEALNNYGNALLGLHTANTLVTFSDPKCPETSDPQALLHPQTAPRPDTDRLAEALSYYDKALAFKPDYAEAHNNRGTILLEMKRPAEAIASFDTAISLRPDYAEAHNNRGTALMSLNAMTEALANFEAALGNRADYSTAYNNRGIALMDLNRLDDAFANFEKALKIKPDDQKAHYNLGLLNLLQGNFEAGWQEYEWRPVRMNHNPHHLKPLCPVWKGEAIRGKRLLIYDEQGIGDTIQFCRYVPILKAMGAAVTVLVRSNIVTLLAPLLDGIRVIVKPDAGPYDYQCPLLSLPKWLGTTLATIPAPTAYLQADALLMDKWSRALGHEGLKIGIAWQGNPAGQIDIGRSVPLRYFAPLAAIRGVRLISLQKNFGLDQLAALPPGMSVETLGAQFDEGPNAFVDTAAVMASLDLIITSDTSIAHLAGALGRPVWVALKSVPDWRWLLNRQDSPWYPTMRLYRQTAFGDWAGVFERIAADLTRAVPIAA